jgi:hypothetical protein
MVVNSGYVILTVQFDGCELIVESLVEMDGWVVNDNWYF